MKTSTLFAAPSAALALVLGICACEEKPTATSSGGSEQSAQSDEEMAECMGQDCRVALDCADEIDCTRDRFDVADGCVYEPVVEKCDDGDPCTAEVCDVSEGCVVLPAADGTTCASHSVCAGGECVEI